MNNWGPAAVIVLGYVMGFYFQSRQFDQFEKRFDDFKEDLYRYLDAKFTEIDRRLSALEGRPEVNK